MKTKLLLFSLIMLLFSSCEKEEGIPSDYKVQLRGTMHKIEASIWQYGTHIIIHKGKLYALKSSTINLDRYLDKRVTVWGDKVNGYPVDDGPEYIEVKRLVK